jgi:NAD(P)-dependent dehydrogenase (short-subunit alcohol dehydrogenase family)
MVEKVKLAGQVALVTGGSRGLSLAFASALADAGVAVAIVARSTNKASEIANKIIDNGGRALALGADISNAQDVAQVVTTVEAEFGPVDLLVNHASMGSPLGPMWELDPDEWRRNIEINLCGVLTCSRAVLPGMMARRRGRIINVASLAAPMSLPCGPAYVNSKAALIRLNKMLAAESKPYGVSVFAIHPGLVHTATALVGLTSLEGQMWGAWFCQKPEQGVDVPAAQAVQLLLWLASGEADSLSGRFFNLTNSQ